MAYKGKYSGAQLEAKLDHVDDFDSVTAAAMASFNERLEIFNTATSAALASLDERLGSFTPSAIYVSSIANIAVKNPLVVASISASASYSLSATPSAGMEIKTIIRNEASSAITITIPNSGMYVNNGAATLSVAAGKYAEVDAISDGNKVYLRGINA